MIAGIAAALEAGRYSRTVSIDPKQQQDGAEAGDTPLGCSIAYAASSCATLLDYGAKFTGGDPLKKTPRLVSSQRAAKKRNSRRR